MNSPVFQASLSGINSPAVGKITIHFPLLQDEYDNSIYLLTEQGLGDPVRQDCFVTSISGDWPILKRLEGQYVNVDELDYLAKRLDSFTIGEKAQFQGMAHKLDVVNIKDLINLTFCCQQATVVSDFRDLEAVGKTHLLTLNNSGKISLDEYEQTGGKAAAQALLLCSEGQITPYGVVYDNGMELEQLYDGQHLPEYFYEPTVVHIKITRTDGVGGAESLYLPYPDAKLLRTLQRLGATDLSQCTLEVEAADICDAVLSVFTTENDLRQCIGELNSLSRCYCKLDDRMISKFHAVFDNVWPETPAATVRLAENIDLFEFLTGCDTPEELGEYLIKESGHYEYDPNLEGFYNYKKLGEDWIEEHPGWHSEEGYISYEGTIPLQTLLSSSNQNQFLGQQMF